MAISIADRLAIHELMSLHGHLADDGRFRELSLLLTNDATYDVSAYGYGIVTGLPALTELWEASPGEQPVGHHVTNVIVTDGPDGVVTVRSKGLSVMATGECGTVIYEDVVVPTPDGWRIATRKVVPRTSG